MNGNEDIKKQLEIKNKEIYINKLNLDIDNNLEVLVLTIDNSLSLIAKDAIKRILEIEESFINQTFIQESILSFFDSYRENLMDLLDDKKNNLQNILILQDDLEICKTNLNDNYLSIKVKLEDFSKNNIKKLKDNLKTLFEEEFKLKRLEDYLETIFQENLNNKVLDVIKNRDIILLNTFQETYLKYLELNKNTVGV